MISSRSSSGRDGLDNFRRRQEQHVRQPRSPQVVVMNVVLRGRALEQRRRRIASASRYLPVGSSTMTGFMVPASVSARSGRDANPTYVRRDHATRPRRAPPGDAGRARATASVHLRRLADAGRTDQARIAPRLFGPSWARHCRSWCSAATGQVFDDRLHVVEPGVIGIEDRLTDASDSSGAGPRDVNTGRARCDPPVLW